MNIFSSNKTSFPFLYLLVFFLSLPHISFPQERGLIQSKYYSSKDYRASTQNWAIAQDKRGVLYFGNVSGLLEFDGVNWRLIQVPNQSTVRGLAFDINNTLYIGAYNELGYLLPNQTGNMEYHSLNHLIPTEYSDFGEIWDVISFSDTIFFLCDHYLFRYANKKIDTWVSESERFYLSHKVKNTFYVQEMGNGLLKFHNNSLQLVSNGNFFSDKRIHSILPVGDMLVICTRTKGLYTYKRSSGKTEIKPFSAISPRCKKINDYFLEHSFYHGIELPNNRFALSSITGDVVVLDTNWRVVDLITEQTLGIKSSAHFLHYQDNHSLWLALANGISQIEINSPFRYWNEEMGVSGVITDVAQLNEYFYVSTGTGIYYTKELHCSDIELNKFFPVDGKFEQSWSFTYFDLPKATPLKNKPVKSCGPSNYFENKLLLASTSNGVFQIHSTKSQKVAKYTGVFKSYQSRSFPNRLVIGIGSGVAIMEYANGSWIDLGLKYGIEANIRDIGEDMDGNLWLSASYKGLFRVKNPHSPIRDSVKVELFDTSHGLPSNRLNRIIENANDFYFLCEDDNFYKYNLIENRFIEYNPYQQTDSTKDNSAQYIDSLSWRRHRGDFISNFYVVTHEDSVVWFSTNDGIFKHMGGTNRNYFDLPPVLIRRVTTSDSTLFHGTNFTEAPDHQQMALNLSPKINLETVLKYRDNSVTFNFAWPFFEGEKPNLYSYYLVGYDNGWSDWTTETKKEYTNLPEGKYIFKVKAKNLYQIEAQQAQFYFEILPPWYRTFYAYSGYLLISIILITLIVKFYTYRLIKEKEKLEGIVKERTQEILMQNEEILVQAEHLKEANDWISAKNAELEVQKKEIEKKKDQLEVSNATKNKFFRIIAHDLRNPISTLVGSTGYILTDYEEFDKEKTKIFIQDLNKLSLTTYNLLENLLDWSTSQMGEISYEPKEIDLVSIVKENLELVNTKIVEKSIALDLSLPDEITVNADENMIRTVIRNLLTNAVKFTKDNGQIRIYITVKDNLCFLSISDNGIGISKENLNKLFRIEKHVTTPGTHNEKGSGLGLILCKEFVERNGGTITVESEPNAGSTFTISLKIS